MPESFIARLARGLGYAVVGGNAQSWFGPQQPLPPVAPPDVAGRQFDYPFGFNLAVTPRSSEPTGFAELRALADAHDLLRLVIETRKDQMERLTWRIRKRGVVAGAAASDPRIAAITAFFARPDKVRSWGGWLRILLEDLLVIDAPTLYRRRTRGGALWALEPLDGATIKRLIDDWGRTPAPPASAYQQILKGVPAVDYTADELIYAPRNQRVHKAYGYSPVEQVQMSVNIALRRQIYQLQYYTEGNIPEALIGVPDTWNPDQIRQFQAYWDALNAGDTAERRHAKFVPGGVAKTFIPTREPVMKDVFDEWLARIICYAFSVPPSAFTSQVNRATAETVQETSLAEGLAPLQNWVKQLIDPVIAEEFQAPDLEFAWDQDKAVDPAEVAHIATSYVAAGIKSVNEVRAELGLAPVPGGELPQRGGGKGPAADSAGDDAAKTDTLLRFNPNHYGPGERGGQFAPSEGENAAGQVPVVPLADRAKPATRPPRAKKTPNRKETPKPWEKQPHAAFRQAIANAEGSKNKRNNGYGEHNKPTHALGRYQLTPDALQQAGWLDGNHEWNAATGIKSDQQFLDDPNAQERAMTDVMKANERLIKTNHLDREIGLHYTGKDGPITVSQASLAAAVHRWGPTAVKNYFERVYAHDGDTSSVELTKAELAIETRIRTFQHVPY